MFALALALAASWCVDAARGLAVAPATAIFSCGCYWNAQHFFEQRRGVVGAECGLLVGDGDDVLEAVKLELGADPSSFEDALDGYFEYLGKKKGKLTSPRYRYVIHAAPQQRAAAEAAFVRHGAPEAVTVGALGDAGVYRRAADRHQGAASRLLAVLAKKNDGR